MSWRFEPSRLRRPGVLSRPCATRPEERRTQHVFMKLGSEWEGFRVRPHEFQDAGAAVIVLGRYSGRYRATGRDMEANFAPVWRLRDRKIAAFKQYVDGALAQRAVTR